MTRGVARRLAGALALAAAAAGPAVAQQRASGGSITGVVKDSSSTPVPDALVVVHPGNHRTRSDSVGRFAITGLGDDSYTVRAMKLGRAPAEWDVKIAHGGHIEIQLVLGAAVLDTVVVTASRQCSPYSLDGFVCRRRVAAGGVFMDYTDIDDKEPMYTADLFRDVKGFRVDLRATRSGPVRVVVPATGFGCITSLVDGRPTTPAWVVPSSPYDLAAVEVYLRPDSVPKEYERYAWPNGDVTRSGRCSVIVYWTIWAKTGPG